jgi:hypothetical protein
MEGNMNSFEVLSPWAEADPIPWRGINERISDLSGKKIGLLVNSKRTAEPTLKIVEDRLKKRFPDTSFSYFYNLKANEVAIATDKKGAFEKWLDEVDTVISSYGD